MQPTSPALSRSLHGHSRIMKMLLHLPLDGGRGTKAWPQRKSMALERAPGHLWAGEREATEWSPPLRLAVFLAAALGSWAAVLGVAYLLWQAL